MKLDHKAKVWYPPRVLETYSFNRIDITVKQRPIFDKYFPIQSNIDIIKILFGTTNLTKIFLFSSWDLLVGIVVYAFRMITSPSNVFIRELNFFPKEYYTCGGMLYILSDFLCGFVKRKTFRGYFHRNVHL